MRQSYKIHCYTVFAQRLLHARSTTVTGSARSLVACWIAFQRDSSLGCVLVCRSLFYKTCMRPWCSMTGDIRLTTTALSAFLYETIPATPSPDRLSRFRWWESRDWCPVHTYKSLTEETKKNVSPIRETQNCLPWSHMIHTYPSFTHAGFSSWYKKIVMSKKKVITTREP